MDIGAVVGGIGLVAGAVGWLLRLEARINSKMSFKDHDEICERNWKRIDKGFNDINDQLADTADSLEKRDAAAATHRSLISEKLETLKTDVTVLKSHRSNRRR